MMNTTALSATIPPPTVVRRTPRGAMTGLAVVGGGLLIGGALLPWLTVYAGLDTFRGTDGVNGRVLAGAGAAAIACGLVYAWRPSTTMRLAIGTVGFGISGFAAWVIAQLVGTYQQLGNDPFAVPSLGLGAFVALAGGLCVLSTLLAPQVENQSDASALARRHGAERDTRAVLRTGVVAFLLAAAMIHLAVIGPHLSEFVLYAVFFVCAGFVQVGAALLLTLRPSRGLLVMLVVGNAMLIALWAVSRTSGLPIGPTPGVAETVSSPDVLASLAEAVVVGLAALLVWGQRGQLPMRHGLARIGMGAAGLVAASVAVVGIISVQGGGA